MIPDDLASFSLKEFDEQFRIASTRILDQRTTQQNHWRGRHLEGEGERERKKERERERERERVREREREKGKIIIFLNV